MHITSDRYIQKHTSHSYGQRFTQKNHFIAMEDQDLFINHPARTRRVYDLKVFFSGIVFDIESCWNIEATDEYLDSMITILPKIPETLDALLDHFFDHTSRETIREATDIFYNIEVMLESVAIQHSIHNEHFKWKEIL